MGLTPLLCPGRHSLGELLLTAAAPPGSHQPRDGKARHPLLRVHGGPGRGPRRPLCRKGLRQECHTGRQDAQPAPLPPGLPLTPVGPE